MSAVGDRFRRARIARGETLREVARETGLSLTFLSDVERGQRRPNLKQALRLADALSIGKVDVAVDVLNEELARDGSAYRIAYVELGFAVKESA